MSLTPESLVLPAGGLSLLTGVTLILLSLRHQSRTHPIRPTLRPAAWRPVWLQRDHFDNESGFSRYVLGVNLVVGGTLISLLHKILI